MRRWAIRAAQLMSLLWATLFLTVSLLHPLMHNSLQHDGGDCLVCVLHKTASAEPPKAHATIHTTPLGIGESIPLPGEPTASLRRIASRPQIPRAPPA